MNWTTTLSKTSQSILIVEKGCYRKENILSLSLICVTIHSDSGKGLLQRVVVQLNATIGVTIHSDSGKGLLRRAWLDG